MGDSSLQKLRAALAAAGVPDDFSVVAAHQEVPRAIIEQIDRFIDVFERVTTSALWQRVVLVDAPETARRVRPEVCFFSAWDFHLPPDHPEDWRLIEFNDNGSGFLFAAIINRLYYELTGASKEALEAPPSISAFGEQVLTMIEREVRAFFDAWPEGLFLILDDAEALAHGRFRTEHELLAQLFRRRGWGAATAAPGELEWDGRALRHHDRPVSFIVNRSTDFLWQGDVFAAVRAAYAGEGVYVAPNPFSYLTRSDKRLLELLSLPGREEELGIRPQERALLSERVPETRLLSDDNLEEIARRREEFFFKPLYGHAGRGVLPSAQVGRSRLRRFLRKGQAYVAQRTVPKARSALPGASEQSLWADLRVWAYRGERFLVCGRASREPALLDLKPPGGWLPTYVRD